MKYMVCVDSSPQAMAAFDFVTSVARPEQDFILVVAVAELWMEDYLDIETAPPTGMVDKINDANKEEARKLLDSYTIQCENKELKHASMLGQGLVADSILSLADGAKPDVIVMGTRDLDPVTGFIMGTVSSKVSHNSNCSVLIVRHREGKKSQ